MKHRKWRELWFGRLCVELHTAPSLRVRWRLLRAGETPPVPAGLRIVSEQEPDKDDGSTLH